MSNLWQELVENIRTRLSFHSRFLESALRDITEGEMKSAGIWLEYQVQKLGSMDPVVAGYTRFLQDTMREQVFFRRHGTYRHNSFAGVRDSVYFNTEYMSQYMLGLAVSTFLWPNHRLIQRCVSNWIPAGQTGRYLEIGPGHGLHFLHALENTECEILLGVDISPTSAAMTRDLIRYHQAGNPADDSRWRVDEEDFFAFDPGWLADLLVMGEVIEHVEDPAGFLRRGRELLAAGGRLLMTTAINAPEIDHIFLFRSPEDVEQLIGDSGLAIRDRLYVPHHGESLDSCREKKLPVNAAFWLEVD